LDEGRIVEFDLPAALPDSEESVCRIEVISVLQFLSRDEYKDSKQKKMKGTQIISIDSQRPQAETSGSN